MADLEERLAAVARDLERGRGPITADDVLDRAVPRQPVPWALAVAAVIAAAVVATGVLFAINRDGGRDTTRVSVVAPSQTTTTAPVPVDPETTGVIPVDFDTLPDTGLALTEGEQVVLTDFDGRELGRGPLNGWYSNNPDLGVDVVFNGSPGVVLRESPRLLDPLGDGCTSEYGAGGLWVAVCPTTSPSALPDRIVRVSSDGSYETITGPVFELGHWSFALPSPDGKWILGQWSAECEVPIAYLINATTGERRHIGSGDTDESSITGWAPDGRGVVGLGAGECGSSQDEPGTYLLDPTTMDLQRIRPEGGGAVFTRTVATRLERWFGQAVDELGLKTCACYDHNIDPTASVGLVLEGHDVAVGIAPADRPDFLPQRDGVAATCGSFRFLFSQFLEPVDTSLLERARDLLLPHLYCVIPPP